MPFTVYAPGEYAKDGSEKEKMHCRSYGVATNTALQDSWALKDFADGKYHLQVLGPNGFMVECKGTNQDPKLAISCGYETTNGGAQTGNLEWQLANNSSSAVTVLITDLAYGAGEKRIVLSAGIKKTLKMDLQKNHNWYDVAISAVAFPEYQQRFAGRVETGKDGFSDPVMGGMLA